MFYCIDYLHVLSVLWSSKTRCKTKILIKVRFFTTAFESDGPYFEIMGNGPGPP